MDQATRHGPLPKSEQPKPEAPAAGSRAGFVRKMENQAGVSLAALHGLGASHHSAPVERKLR
jgi:hypothetical protein